MASAKNGDYTGAVVVGGSVWFVHNYSDAKGTLGHWQTDPRSTFSRGVSTGGEGPYGVVAAGGYLWVPNFVTSNVAQIDPATDARVGMVNDVGGTQNPDGIAAGFGAVWVADEHSGSVTRIDPATGRKDTRSVHAGASALAIGTTRIWVLETSAGRVIPVRPWSAAATGTATTGPSAHVGVSGTSGGL